MFVKGEAVPPFVPSGRDNKGKRPPSGSAVAHGGDPQDHTASPRRRYAKRYPLGQAQGNPKGLPTVARTKIGF
ncbi:MAG: hypothetical protein AAFQ80_00645 [Cyanobacteria bacterium J06621_8]